MKSSTVTVYRCDHCSRRPYLSRSACARHEAMCFGNPNRSACPACQMTGRVPVADYRDDDCPACERWAAIHELMKTGKSFNEASVVSRDEACQE